MFQNSDAIAIYAMVQEKLFRRNQRLNSKEILVYYSPFLDCDITEYYAYNAFYVVNPTAEDFFNATVGDIIPPNEPYYLVENDILIEFY